MARPLRLELAGGLYHVTSRGHPRDTVYNDDIDRNQWLDIFTATCTRFKWRCFAYCLMDDHYHLLIETKTANLSRGMRQLNGIYTQFFNRRHQHTGPIYRGRFKAVLVDPDMYLLQSARYIVLNPIRCGITSNLDSWHWSSYQAMMGKADPPSWLDIKRILSQFSKNPKKAQLKYIEYVQAGINLPSIWIDLKHQIFLGSEPFILKKQKQLHKKGTALATSQPVKKISSKPLDYYHNKYTDQNKAILKAYLSGSYTLKQIGDYYGKHLSTISRIVKLNE